MSGAATPAGGARRIAIGRPDLVTAALIGATAAKLALTGVLGSTADVGQTRSAAEALLAGLDLLEPGNTGSNPAYLLAGHALLASACLLVARATGLSFDVTLKAPTIVSDLGVALLLRAMPRGGTRAALLYMFNPVTFVLSVYHGQLHTVAVAAAVFALWLADRRRFVASGVMLACAAAVRQHFAALIVPLVARSAARRAAILVAFVSVLLVVNAPLLGSAHPERVFAPVSNYGLWGYAMVLQHGPRLLTLLGLSDASFLMPVNRVLERYGVWLSWLWIVAFTLWIGRRIEDQWRATLVFLLGLYAVGTGFGVQRLVWVIPFWLVVNLRHAVVYSALAGAYLLGTYWQWGLNGKYGVGSLVANLQVLTGGDLVGVLVVATVGFVTWAYAARIAWVLARA